MLRKQSALGRGRWLAVPCGFVVAAIGTHAVHGQNYIDVVNSQTPLLQWRLNEQVNPGDNSDLTPQVNNLDALLGEGNFEHSANFGSEIIPAQPSMEPSSGFDGFEAGNTAFNFNLGGAGSVIDAITIPRNSVGMDAGSISMWVKSDNPSAADEFLGGVLYRGDEGGGNNLRLRFFDLGGNGLFSLGLEEGEFLAVAAETSGATDYSDGQWHHVAATWEYDIDADAGSLNLYINGGDLAGGEQSSTAFDSESYAPILQESDPDGNPGVFDDVMDFDFRNRMGKGRNNAMRYTGDLDEPALWNRALSPQEIADQFNAAFTAGSGLVGDLNGDGFVGAGDLDILLGVWNQNDTGAADLNDDGFIGAGDLDILLGNWNAGTAPGGASAVPEPASLTLMALGVAAMARRRRG